MAIERTADLQVLKYFPYIFIAIKDISNRVKYLLILDNSKALAIFISNFQWQLNFVHVLAAKIVNSNWKNVKFVFCKLFCVFL